MDKQSILKQLQQNIVTVVPGLEGSTLGPEDSLRELGANSIDRAEIIIITMASLKIKQPLIAFAKAKNIGEIVEILHQGWVSSCHTSTAI